jgi:phosphate:Na+ symporter
MTSDFDYWGLLAGIALFLFAMAQLEAGLKTLGGRSLAVYLKQRADQRVNAVLGGIVGTALLQSSSVVGLMVLAFTGAGLLNLTSALGIVFGSNLGTTLTGWIVALLGFKFEIFELSLPLVGVGGLAFVFSKGRWKEYGRAVLGLGLLLMGLQLMKTSVVSVEQLIGIDDLANLAPWQYLLFGTIVAAVIQSSSATMIITLAALNANIIDLPNAAAIAIGADLGTTTTVMIGAIGGSHIKQQVAAGHVIFNLVTDLIAFVLRLPLLGLIAFIGIDDPLYALVAFHSLFNLMGLILFVPLTGPFARRLETLIPQRDAREARYLGEVSRGVGRASVEAVERETSLLIARSVRLIMLAFEPPLAMPAGNPPMPHRLGIEAQASRPFDELYRATKNLEGEVVEFTIRLQARSLDPADSQRLSQLLSAAREAMHSAKAIKNIRHNLLELGRGGGAFPASYVDAFRQFGSTFVQELFRLRSTHEDHVTFEELAALLRETHRLHDALHDDIYAGVRENCINQTQVSSLLNVNRELLTSGRSLVFALGDYFLDAARADALERAPE